jgi:hypothetical protein
LEQGRAPGSAGAGISKTCWRRQRR